VWLSLDAVKIFSLFVGKIRILFKKCVLKSWVKKDEKKMVVELHRCMNSQHIILVGTLYRVLAPHIYMKRCDVKFIGIS